MENCSWVQEMEDTRELIREQFYPVLCYTIPHTCPLHVNHIFSPLSLYFLKSTYRQPSSLVFPGHKIGKVTAWSKKRGRGEGAFSLLPFLPGVTTMGHLRDLGEVDFTKCFHPYCHTGYFFKQSSGIKHKKRSFENIRQNGESKS